MEVKKLYVILLFSCLLISLTAISASEDINVTADDMGDDMISVSDNDEILIDDVKPIDDLNSKIGNSSSGSTIKLENDYVISNSTKIDGIDIYTGNLTIDGQGHVINATSSNMDYLFRIHDDNVSLKNIKFTNLEFVHSYNAVEWFGANGKLINCTFENNYGYNGGAVDWTGFDGQIINCTFISNIAEKGGAIYYYGDYGVIFNCTFRANIASHGGAVYVGGRNNTVSRCSFADNIADNGGAVYWDNIYSNLFNSTFTNNHAENGGAIYTLSYKSNITSCEFRDNIADDVAGAIYCSANRAVISNSIFKNNTALNAGAVYGDFGDEVLINNSVFTNNSAKELGGAVFIEEEALIFNSQFTNNVATLGGALYCDSEISIQNSTFEDNSAESGGAIVMHDGSIINSTFTGNHANSTAGAIMGAGEFFVCNTTFTKNSANDGGNNIVLTDSSDLSIENVTSDSSLIYKLVNMDISMNNIVYGQSLKIDVNLNDDLNDGQLHIMVNDKEFTFNVTNGIVNASIPDLNAGSYTIKIFYNGSKYSTQVVEDYISVLAKNVVINAKKVTFTINYAKKYSVTVSDTGNNAVANEKVIFYINNKMIGMATTDNKGIAAVTVSAKTLKSLKAGTKTLKVILDNKNYSPVSKNVNVVINKEKTKLTAGKKTFKKSVKIKKYTVKLKNSKGKAIKKVKITLKIKGKLYKAKTNSKGKATFKIKKLSKKGKFKAVIKYSGNKYYKAVTKKVKITVR